MNTGAGLIEIGAGDGGSLAAALAAPGGFAWWYADLVAPGGDGAVLIWSYGLPFLPGYADAARRGRAPLPVARPSINLVTYRAGRPDFYLLQELPPAPAPASPDDLRLGGSRFVRTLRDGRCTLDARLSLRVPGLAGPVEGELHLEGARPGLPAGGGAGPHQWTPLAAPAEGELVLRAGGRTTRLRGRAYHDANQGRLPLHALGIRRWMWGRVPLHGGERVYYLTWPQAGGDPVFFGVEMGADGGARVLPLEVEAGAERWTFGGLRRPVRLRLSAGGTPWMEVTHPVVADAGPFYLRLLAEARLPTGERATGWGELCWPARVDLARHRPFVRMRVHREAGGNSVWLPLFSGPRAGRAGRLLRGLAGSWSAP